MIALRSYLAYKSLRRDEDGALVSPKYPQRWVCAVLPDGIYPALIAGDHDLDSGHGVYAASYETAKEYGDEIYLVAPAPELVDGDDEDVLVLAEDGWRSRAAIVVAGPVDPLTGAEIIISAHQAGYPQVDNLLYLSNIIAGEQPADIDDMLPADIHNWARRILAMGAAVPDYLRQRILSSPASTPEYVYWYALDIDQAPRDDTRAAACASPEFAYQYAQDVDRAPRDDTRTAACASPEFAYWYARDVDRAPRDDTRAAACANPAFAYRYARDIDRAPRDDTRAAACAIPEFAYLYARYIDRAPRDDTRASACASPKYAYRYARDVDRAPRDDTRAAACDSPKYAYRYALDVDRAPKEGDK